MADSPRLLSPTFRLASPCLVLGAITTLLAVPGTARGQDATAGEDLLSIFDLGGLVADTNGDEVPNAIQDSLVLGASASTAELAAMNKGGIVINCARGGVVDNDALIAALESGHIRAAGVDVMPVEPPEPDHPLILRHDVVMTPHNGAGVWRKNTRECKRCPKYHLVFGRGSQSWRLFKFLY